MSQTARGKVQPNSRPARSAESGYALLMVLFMVSVMLLMAIAASPSILTEGRREKEQELVWRGNQYMRAIRLYYQKYGKYPQTVDDLIKGDATDVHFLRKAYTDPMNSAGKWRFIYVSPSGQLIGSVKYHSLQEMAGVIGLGAQAAAAAANGDTSDRQNGQQNAQQNGQQPGNTQQQGGSTATSAPGDPNAAQSAQAAQQNGSQNGGSQQTSSQQTSSQQSGIQSGFGPQSSQFGGGQGGSGLGAGFGSGFQGQGQPQGQGLPGSQGFGSGFGSQSAGSGFGGSSQPVDLAPLQAVDGPVLGGSVVGVASKVKQDSLRVYQGGKKYFDWEFIWNPLMQTNANGQPGAGIQTGIVAPAGINGATAPGSNINGTPGANSPNSAPTPAPMPGGQPQPMQ